MFTHKFLIAFRRAIDAIDRLHIELRCGAATLSLPGHRARPSDIPRVQFAM
jgi:hypothetical protein